MAQCVHIQDQDWKKRHFGIFCFRSFVPKRMENLENRRGRPPKPFCQCPPFRDVWQGSLWSISTQRVRTNETHQNATSKRMYGGGPEKPQLQRNGHDFIFNKQCNIKPCISVVSACSIQQTVVSPLQEQFCYVVAIRHAESRDLVKHSQIITYYNDHRLAESIRTQLSVNRDGEQQRHGMVRRVRSFFLV